MSFEFGDALFQRGDEVFHFGGGVYFGRHFVISDAPERDPLMEEEIAFLHARDSFYMASITENGWPYMQHRGGPPGFLRVINPTQLAFADFKGNRQMLSTSNLTANDRVALFFMD